MNILIVAPDFKPSHGGVAEYTHQLARKLHEAGDTVAVLSKRVKNDHLFDSTCPYSVYRSNFGFMSTGKVMKYYRSYRWLKRFVTKLYPIDVIISNCYGISAIVSLAVSKTLNIPFSIFTHGLEINRKKVKERYKIKKVLLGAGRIFCNSSYTQKLVSNFGIPFEKTTVVPGGLSIEEYNLRGSKSASALTISSRLQGKKVIFTCGRLVERKGHDMVIKALPLIRQTARNAVYVIAGEGPHKAVLESLIRKYRMDDHVIFTGWVDDQTKQNLFRLCDVFVMPCRELDNGDVEGFGLVFLEANAFRKPVIAGRSGGATDAVIHNKTGLLVDPLSVDEIANAATYLLTHPQVAKRMGKEGQKRVENELNWSTSGEKMRKSLLRLVSYSRHMVSQ